MSRRTPWTRIAAVIAAGGIAGAARAATPEVPAPLRVPAGARLTARLHGRGDQVYACAAVNGRFAWTLRRPDATLFEASGVAAGTHGAGPTWTAKDGSAVVGEKVAQVDAPAAGAIPWLLLRAKSSSGAGRFSQVTYIQRLGTQGGQAPTGGCDAGHVGTETRAGYSADYLFYTGAAAPLPSK